MSGFRMATPTVFELSFETEQPLEFLAGQFLSVIVPGAGPGGKDLRRAYSIASPPNTKPIQLCIKIVENGPGTSYLSQLRPGIQFKGVAPYGNFVFKHKPGRHAVFIATGTGVSPFRSISTSKTFQQNLPKSTTLLFGVREETELLYVDELSKLSFLKFIPMVSRPTIAPESQKVWTKGRVTDYLRKLGPEYPWLETDFYLCGNGAMIDEAKSILTANGVQKDSIHQEIYYKPKPGEES